MTDNSPFRVRRDIRDLERDWKWSIAHPTAPGSAARRKPLETLLKAFKGIQELPSEHPCSFFRISGYHGQPFRGAGYSNASWWGGYCNHGNILFPVWHRAYLLELENALRSIDGCENVTIPFWNETDDAMREDGLPEIFLMQKVPLEGELVENPLRSYKFRSAVKDNLSQRPAYDYTKHKNYETVRYPYSGLVGESDHAATQLHNEKMREIGIASTNRYLNENIKSWLGFSIKTWEDQIIYTGVRVKYDKCLEAPNYTVFSNTTSATKWNEDHFEVKEFAPKGTPGETLDVVVPIESPHNSIHLAVGGFEIPNNRNYNSIQGCSGDMGENDTASFDPLFYFHHCFIDKLFWEWQKRHDRTEFLDVIDKYPGTNSADDQGATAGVPGNTWLSMDTPLEPFMRWSYAPCDKSTMPTHMQSDELLQSGALPLEERRGVITPQKWAKSSGAPPPIPGDWPIRTWPLDSWPPSEWPPQNWPHQVPVTGKDVVNINKLGYTYDTFKSDPNSAASTNCSLEIPEDSLSLATEPTPVVQVPDVNRAQISGSFTISTFANDRLVDVNPILSRWHVQGCANCMTHINVRSFVPLHGWTMAQAKAAKFTFRVHRRRHAHQAAIPEGEALGDEDYRVKIGYLITPGQDEDSNDVEIRRAEAVAVSQRKGAFRALL